MKLSCGLLDSHKRTSHAQLLPELRFTLKGIGVKNRVAVDTAPWFVTIAITLWASSFRICKHVYIMIHIF